MSYVVVISRFVELLLRRWVCGGDVMKDMRMLLKVVL
jgi:hypothetical protein